MTVSRDALVLEHLHLIPAVARHFLVSRASLWVAGIDRDDLLAAGREALVRAASTWEPDRGEFSSYAWTAIDWAMRGEQRAMRWRRQGHARRDRTLVSMHGGRGRSSETIADIVIDPASLDAPSDVAVTVRAAVAQLRPVLREAVRLCWLQDMAQADAAAMLGITQPAVAMRLRDARRELAVALADFAPITGEVVA